MLEIIYLLDLEQRFKSRENGRGVYDTGTLRARCGNLKILKPGMGGKMLINCGQRMFKMAGIGKFCAPQRGIGSAQKFWRRPKFPQGKGFREGGFLHSNREISKNLVYDSANGAPPIGRDTPLFIKAPDSDFSTDGWGGRLLPACSLGPRIYRTGGGVFSLGGAPFL